MNWSSKSGHRLRCLCRFLLHSYWRQVVVVAVEPSAVVVHEEANHVGLCFFGAAVAFARYPFRLQRSEKPLRRCVVPTLPTMAHALQYAISLQLPLKLAARVLAALIRMEHQPWCTLSKVCCHAQCFADQVGIIDQGKRPANDTPRKQVDHDCQVAPAFSH